MGDRGRLHCYISALLLGASLLDSSIMAESGHQQENFCQAYAENARTNNSAKTTWVV